MDVFTCSQYKVAGYYVHYGYIVTVCALLVSVVYYHDRS